MNSLYVLYTIQSVTFVNHLVNRNMSGNIFIKSCEVSPNGDSLDPCSCDHYYDKSRPFEPQRRKCPSGQLWDHNRKQCRNEDTVLRNRLCDPQKPWGRCINNREDQLRVVKTRCVKDGLFTDNNGGNSIGADGGGTRNPVYTSKLISKEVQNANIGLVLAAMVAGAIIALMLAAIIITFWGNCLHGFRGSTKITMKRKRTKKTEVVTEGDNISVVYEDIDDEKNTATAGYIPMFQDHSTSGHSSRSVVKTVEVSKSLTTASQVKPIVTQQKITRTTHETSSTSRSVVPGAPSKPKIVPIAPTRQEKSTPATPKKPPQNVGGPVQSSSRPPPPSRKPDQVVINVGKKEPIRPLRPNFTSR